MKVDHLTLTRVVFELYPLGVGVPERSNLTLTRVVFESKIDKDLEGTWTNLTLTRVVFELDLTGYTAEMQII